MKAELDYCCTSGNVLDVIDAIPEDKGILFLPDFFLGAHVRRMRPHRRVEVWLGECHVHKGIRAETLNAARDRYRGGARSAAGDAGIPYDDFIARIGLVNRDFVDVAHLVEPGRAKYQRRLSQVVVTRLKQYGLAQ